MEKKTPKPSQISLEVVGALADAFGKSTLTIQRWIQANDDRLTSEKARDVFRRKGIAHQIAKVA